MPAGDRDVERNDNCLRGPRRADFFLWRHGWCAGAKSLAAGRHRNSCACARDLGCCGARRCAVHLKRCVVTDMDDERRDAILREAFANLDRLSDFRVEERYEPADDPLTKWERGMPQAEPPL